MGEGEWNISDRICHKLNVSLVFTVTARVCPHTFLTPSAPFMLHIVDLHILAFSAAKFKILVFATVFRN